MFKLPKTRYITETQCILSFCLAALLLWGMSLGNLPLRDWDEATRALIAREIYRTGNWLHPTLQGQPYLLKPPLMDWLIALSYKFGNISEFTTRLPGAFLSACGVPLIYIVAREIFAKRLPALCSAGVYLTLLPVVRHGRLAMLDGTVVSFFLLLLLSLLKTPHDKRWGIGIGIALGLIALTKGILVILLGGIVLFFILADRHVLGVSQFCKNPGDILPPPLNNKNLGDILPPPFNKGGWGGENSGNKPISLPKRDTPHILLFKNPYFWLGIVIGNLPITLWYLSQLQYYGATFWQIHFQSQGLERISQSVEGNSGNPWYYLLELLKYTLPWLLFLPGGLHLAWQNRQRSWGKLVLIGSIVYLGTISLMGTKLPWYIMPLYPFFALAVGAQLADFWVNSRDEVSPTTQSKKRYARIIVWMMGAIAIAGLGGSIYFIIVDPQPVLIIMSCILVAMMALVTWQFKQESRTFIPILLIGMYLILLLLMTSKSWIWELNETFPVKPVATLILKKTPPETPIYTSFPYHRPSLDYYSDRQIIPRDTATLQKLALTPTYLLLDTQTLKILKLPNTLTLGSAEGFTLLTTKN
ncbi:MAG TPA: phospholipid carrier-dependent glycosyltransferase [Cyanobacteria bacterium UBA11149]|nr:phospholipid carrier-dependent glycosyltransferase [Cyanobacteria bacterium UBA11367]HBE56489.1 phospholipid carrier-dependent glycosyltransferase [Cyanobacteria bacterium UBA11366]HBK64952.1 phospholipid carrier-dependent glycosyltransferase [Cyanobacteria bacterium UBA11166]HBR76968.1 phospholipid carrier-dependent glycosyltransferase [Cyanobacteria bacterium UBA11159]HBS71969.1 phospholipid carrier-dependent glycosyltransferase [Cyanobacteria bacterium UBA11153]HBW91062.1 phospholipid ca